MTLYQQTKPDNQDSIPRAGSPWAELRHQGRDRAASLGGHRGFLVPRIQRGAIYNTDISYPPIIAHELGFSDFRYPIYRGPGGLPFNIEYVLRDLEAPSAVARGA